MDTDRSQKILQMATEGKTYNQIGEEFKISRQMVQNILKRMGFRKREPKMPIELDKNDVFFYIVEYKMKFRGHGPFPIEISRRFGVPPSRVDKILEELQKDKKILVLESGVNRKIIVEGSEWIPPKDFDFSVFASLEPDESQVA